MWSFPANKLPVPIFTSRLRENPITQSVRNNLGLDNCFSHDSWQLPTNKLSRLDISHRDSHLPDWGMDGLLVKLWFAFDLAILSITVVLTVPWLSVSKLDRWGKAINFCFLLSAPLLITHAYLRLLLHFWEFPGGVPQSPGWLQSTLNRKKALDLIFSSWSRLNQVSELVRIKCTGNYTARLRLILTNSTTVYWKWES